MRIGRWRTALTLARSLAHEVHANAQAGKRWTCDTAVQLEAAIDLTAYKHSTQRIYSGSQRCGWMEALSGMFLAYMAGSHECQMHAEKRLDNDSMSLIMDQELDFLGEVKRDPRAAVVGLFTLPLLSLSLGYQPSAGIMERGAVIVEDHLLEFEPWEIVVLLWGCARLGLTPSQSFLEQSQAVLINSKKLRGCEAVAGLWALCMLDQVDEESWTSFMSLIAQMPVDEFDEASILHLLQASFICASKSKRYSKKGEIRPPKVELEKLLSPLPWKVVRWCMDAHYEFVPFHPYLDGPYLTMSFMMQMLRRFKSADCPDIRPSYLQYMGGVSNHDLEWANKALLDSRKLSQLKRELFYQWRGNEIVDKWQQVVNEVVFLLAKSLGNVVDQPLDCDISLPRKKIAIFIEDDRPRPPVQNLKEAGEGMLHLFGTETAIPTSGFALHECTGTKSAKRQMLQRQGWKVVVIPFSVWNALSDTIAKQNLLQEALTTGELQEGMSSLFQSAMRR